MMRVLGCIFNQGSFTAPKVDMSDKTIVVTGPSIGGIGFETALGLADFGAKVYLASRSIEKGEATAAAIREKVPNAQVEVLRCDVSDLESVREMAAPLATKDKPAVDVLVSNAGSQSDTHSTNKEGVDMTFAACALGHHLLAHLLKPSRVVTVTGDIYCIAKGPADPFCKEIGTEAYARACLGRLLLGSEMRKGTETHGKPEVIVVHPGVIATNLMGATGIGKSIMNAAFLTPKAGAQASIFAASCPSSEIPEDAFYFHNKRRWVKLPPDDKASDSEAAKALFDKCNTICGI
ncbi:unnamed protein product [Ascophyllum nodosum]